MATGTWKTHPQCSTEGKKVWARCTEFIFFRPACTALVIPINTDSWNCRENQTPLTLLFSCVWTVVLITNTEPGQGSLGGSSGCRRDICGDTASQWKLAWSVADPGFHFPQNTPWKLSHRIKQPQNVFIQKDLKDHLVLSSLTWASKSWLLIWKGKTVAGLPFLPVWIWHYSLKHKIM